MHYNGHLQVRAPIGPFWFKDDHREVRKSRYAIGAAANHSVVANGFAESVVDSHARVSRKATGVHGVVAGRIKKEKALGPTSLALRTVGRS